jgi:hypothetical protein
MKWRCLLMAAAVPFLSEEAPPWLCKIIGAKVDKRVCMAVSPRGFFA